ncbi:uncharacterized protein LOC130136998 [Syzygium oleosum]|uniref:uncharacterized protein LOC130136998 n=1 Tax=Syzygium oleosum TaxID=219896 RepID=UPI0024B96E91|nr:uncharacterized protein LOC130136998 [Syzygium oleosum]
MAISTSLSSSSSSSSSSLAHTLRGSSSSPSMCAASPTFARDPRPPAWGRALRKWRAAPREGAPPSARTCRPTTASGSPRPTRASGGAPGFSSTRRRSGARTGLGTSARRRSASWTGCTPPVAPSGRFSLSSPLRGNLMKGGSPYSGQVT